MVDPPELGGEALLVHDAHGVAVPLDAPETEHHLDRQADARDDDVIVEHLLGGLVCEGLGGRAGLHLRELPVGEQPLYVHVLPLQLVVGECEDVAEGVARDREALIPVE